MSNITVTTTLTRLAELQVQQDEVVTLHMKNRGANALNAFQLRGRGARDVGLGFVNLQTAGFTTPGVHCLYASSDPASLAGGAECILYLTPGQLTDIEFWASVAAGTTDVLVGITRQEG